jgi:hypothetical protein
MCSVNVLIPVMICVVITAKFTSALAQQSGETEFQTCAGTQSDTLPVGIEPGIYRGKLGNRTIILELAGGLNLSGDTELAIGGASEMQMDRYSGDRSELNLKLSRGTTAGNGLLLVESVFEINTAAVRGCLELKATGERLTGQWRSPDGQKRLPVSLAKVNVAASPLALPSSLGLLKLRSDDPFTFLKVNHPWVTVPGGLKKPSGLKEPLSGVVYPRIVGGSLVQGSAVGSDGSALNLALQDRQLSRVQEALDCLNNTRDDLHPTSFEGVGVLTWRGPRLISLLETVDYDCGGAHPDSSRTGLTLDATTGREVVLAGKPGSLWPKLSAQKLDLYYQAGYPRQPEIADCQGIAEAGVGPLNIYLTQSGLALWPNLNHATYACSELVTVPYARLRTFAEPASVFFREVYPR